LASGASRVGAVDLDEAAESCDAQSIRDARLQETQLWGVSQLLLAFVDTDGTSIPDIALGARLHQLAHVVSELCAVRDGAWGTRRRLRDIDARVTGRTFVVTFSENDTFDAGEYENALVSGWLDPETAADQKTMEAAFTAVDSDGPWPDELRQADRLMVENFGTSIVHLLRTARVLSAHPKGGISTPPPTLTAVSRSPTSRERSAGHGQRHFPPARSPPTSALDAKTSVPRRTSKPGSAARSKPPHSAGMSPRMSNRTHPPPELA
jgi:hypothetical protein